MDYKSIAIDGPAGAGKSTLATLLAERLGFVHVDTGALYRTVGLYAFEHGICPTDAARVIAMLDEVEVDLRYEQGGQRMYLCGRDVTGEIRQHEISQYASDVSAIAEVRDFLMETQRMLARTRNVIMDGRDIGTVVLPDADLKIFLTATAEVRAHRRHAELTAKGEMVTFETVLADLCRRDENDARRAAAPLKQAEDALLLDTTDCNLEQSLEKLTALAKERLGQ